MSLVRRGRARLERAQAMQARVDAALDGGRGDELDDDASAAPGDLGAAIGAARAARRFSSSSSRTRALVAEAK